MIGELKSREWFQIYPIIASSGPQIKLFNFTDILKRQMSALVCRYLDYNQKTEIFNISEVGQLLSNIDFSWWLSPLQNSEAWFTIPVFPLLTTRS